MSARKLDRSLFPSAPLHQRRLTLSPEAVRFRRSGIGISHGARHRAWTESDGGPAITAGRSKKFIARESSWPARASLAPVIWSRSCSPIFLAFASRLEFSGARPTELIQVPCSVMDSFINSFCRGQGRRVGHSPQDRHSGYFSHSTGSSSPLRRRCRRRNGFKTSSKLSCRKHARTRLDADREVDFSYFFPGVGRFRTNVFQQRGQLCLAMRFVKTQVPSFEELA